MIRTVLIGFVLVLLVIGGYVVYGLWLRSGGEQEVMVRVPEGAAFDHVLDSLEGAGVLEDRLLFRLYAIATGSDTRLRPGTYKFTDGVAAARLLDALVEGRSTVREKVTFPEGITVRRMASIVQNELGIDSAEFVRLAGDEQFLDSIGIDAPTAEGHLLPDTYFFFWGTSPEHVITEMASLFQSFYTDELKSRAARQDLTPYEALVLASIVEGEARVGEERPVIAGLYLNRLERGMKLQADPTVQYIIPDGPRRLLYRDLRIDSPYNTYRYEGLPPTPINNPGRSSIRAVLEAEDHDYLYMVAKADGSGRHTFTSTGREHQAAAREFRQNRREQVRELERQGQ